MCKPKSDGGLGFRSIQDASHIHFIKLWVKFWKRDSLWAEFMFHKYYKAASPSLVSPHAYDSVCWKEILKWRETAESFIRWEIGKGQLAFWFDNWIDLDLREGCYGPFNPEFLVKDCWENDSWNLGILTSLVRPRVAQTIASIPITAEAPDILHTSPPSKQAFTTAILERLSVAIQFDWGRKIWHRRIQPSQSFFLWRLLHNIIPTDDILKMKGLRIVSICHLCRNAEESVDHLFRGCSFARAVWHKLGIATGKPLLTGLLDMSADFNSWIKSVGCSQDFMQFSVIWRL